MNKLGVALASFLLVACVLTGSTQLLAQTGANNSDPALAKRLTMDDLIKLSKAGFSDDVIIQKIKKNGQAFDLSPDQMIQLKSAGVSDKVVQVMLDPAKADTPPTPAASSPRCHSSMWSPPCWTTASHSRPTSTTNGATPTNPSSTTTCCRTHPMTTSALKTIRPC